MFADRALMNGTEPQNIVIPCRGTTRLDNVRGMTLRVVRGSVWVTQCNSREDVSLDAGASFCVTRDGPTLVAACHDAPCTVITLERPAVTPTLRERLRRILYPINATPSNAAVLGADLMPAAMYSTASNEVASAHGRRRRFRLALVATVAVAGFAMGLFAARHALAAAGAEDPAYVAHAAVAARAEDPITGQFFRFALNALLVPLLDDHQPPHWTDIGMRFFCGPATGVEVDGRPLVVGASMPASAFTVRWHIDQCRPLDRASFALSGDVELLVFHEDGGLSAVVNAQRLKVSTATGSSQISTPFAASMLLIATPDLPAPLTAP